MEQIVTEIDNHVPVSRQCLDCFPADLGRLLILALESEVPLLFSQDLGLPFHAGRDATQPSPCQVQVVRFNCGVHSTGQNQGLLRRLRIPFAVGVFGLCKFPASGVEIAKRKIWYIQCGIRLLQALKILLRILIAPCCP